MYFLASNVENTAQVSAQNILQLATQDITPTIIIPTQKGQRTIPVRLIIPQIGVDAEVESVGLTIKGAMNAPKGPLNVGWLNINPSPGENGNAVIDGHRGWKDHILAVFDRLHELRTGDRIYVKNSEGFLITFVVREIRTYAPGEDASRVFGANIGAHLNLITCDGDWDVGTKSYSRRLVVFADEVIE